MKATLENPQSPRLRLTARSSVERKSSHRRRTENERKSYDTQKYVFVVRLVGFLYIVDGHTASAIPGCSATGAGQYQDEQGSIAPHGRRSEMNASDREITQKIRKSIHHDNSLSTYAHNIKIISQDGRVTLRGPVRSEDDKKNLQAKAVAVAGEGNVTNLLEIAPSK